MVRVVKSLPKKPVLGRQYAKPTKWGRIIIFEAVRESGFGKFVIRGNVPDCARNRKVLERNREFIPEAMSMGVRGKRKRKKKVMKLTEKRKRRLLTKYHSIAGEVLRKPKRRRIAMAKKKGRKRTRASLSLHSRIMKLRKQKKTMKQIQKAVGKSNAIVRYHLYRYHKRKARAPKLKKKRKGKKRAKK